jgi:hypothetical protein
MRFESVMFAGLCFALIAISAGAQNTFPATGNVGIGTTSPASPLSVSGAGSGATMISLSSSTANQYTQLGYVGTGRTYFSGVGNAAETGYNVPNKWYVFDASADAMRLVVDPAGNIGIGTPSPAATLHIAQGGNVAGVGGSIGISANAGAAPMFTIQGSLYNNGTSGDSGNVFFNLRPSGTSALEGVS